MSCPGILLPIKWLITLRFTYWLWAMMSVVLVRKIFVGIVHVFTGVNVEILLLGVLDVEEVVLDSGLILSHIGSHNWSVHG